jgi:hypothetical protein
MPLGPILRVPAFVSAGVVVFCLAFVAADADAAGPDCSATTNPSDLRELCLVELDGLVRPDDPGTTPDDERAPWLQLIDADLTNAFAGLPGVNNKLSNLADLAVDSGSGDPWAKRIWEADNSAQAALGDISYDIAEVHSNTNNIGAKLDTIHDDLVDVAAAIDAQGPNGTLTGPSGDDSDPVRVQLASSETQLDDAANAGLGALWFLAGLLVVVVVAGAIRKAAMPR